MYFDAVIIGGGPAGVTVATILSQSGLSCALVARGRSLSDVNLMGYKGTYLPSDTVLSGKFEGNRLVSVSTKNLGPDALEARYFILATGKFTGCGLKSDGNRVYEPILGLDVNYDSDRSRWFSEDFFSPQPFLKFGVAIDSNGRAFKDGKILDNVYAVGEVLAGVSIVECPEEIANSAKMVANAII